MKTQRLPHITLQASLNRRLKARGHYARIHLCPMPDGTLGVDCDGINSGETIRGMNLALYCLSGAGWVTTVPNHSGDFAIAKARKGAL